MKPTPLVVFPGLSVGCIIKTFILNRVVKLGTIVYYCSVMKRTVHS